MNADELRRLLGEATPGPWTRDEYGLWVEDITDADAELVVALRNAAPALLDAWEERERLRETVKRLNRRVQTSESAVFKLEWKRMAGQFFEAYMSVMRGSLDAKERRSEEATAALRARVENQAALLEQAEARVEALEAAVREIRLLVRGEHDGSRGGAEVALEDPSLGHSIIEGICDAALRGGGGGA